MTTGSLEQYAVGLARAARAAGRKLAVTSGQQRNEALLAMAAGLREQADRLIAENARDLAKAPEYGLTKAMIDRLRLDRAGVEKMARSVQEVAAQTDPVGQT